MMVDGGSQNASRIQGEYAYVNRTYRTDPIQPAGRIPPGTENGSLARVHAIADRDPGFRMLQPTEEDIQSVRNAGQPNSYQEAAFRNADGVTVGLFLNILG